MTPPTLTGQESFRLRVQRSEEVRTLLMIGLFATLIVIAIVRRLAGGEVMRNDALFWPAIAIFAALLATETVALMMVRKANRQARLLGDLVWQGLTAVELAGPLGGMALLVIHPAVPALDALSGPSLLVLPIVIVLSILHLRPHAALLTGLLAAAGHLLLVIWAISIARPPAEAYPRLLSYPIALAIAGIAAAIVTRNVKRYLHEVVEESSAREAADRKLGHINRELSLARDIQQGFLPSSLPNLDGFEIAGFNRPADLTGGDYFDWQELPDGKLLLVMADVTGHGIAPAIVMAVCRAYARASAPLMPNPHELLTRLNRLVYDDVQGRRFITLAIALLDPKAATVELASAGHGPTLHYHAADQSVESFGGDGIPLGLVAHEDYEQPRTLKLEPGDVLLLSTDGYFEWQRPGDDEQFGTKRLEAALKQHAAAAPDQIIAQIDSAVRAFAHGSPQPDDMTAIALKRIR